jgi:hypothetical protein
MHAHTTSSAPTATRTTYPLCLKPLFKHKSSVSAHLHAHTINVGSPRAAAPAAASSWKTENAAVMPTPPAAAQMVQADKITRYP